MIEKECLMNSFVENTEYSKKLSRIMEATKEKTPVSCDSSEMLYEVLEKEAWSYMMFFRVKIIIIIKIVKLIVTFPDIIPCDFPICRMDKRSYSYFMGFLKASFPLSTRFVIPPTFSCFSL